MITKGNNGGTFNQYMNYLKEHDPATFQSLQDIGGVEGAIRGTPEFQQGFSELMNSNAQAAQSQHNFIQASHYDPQVRKVYAKTGIDISTRSKTLQDVLWSTSVQQNNQSANVFARAINRTGKTAETVGDRELIAAVYDERGAQGGRKYFTTVFNAGKAAPVLARFDRERTEALARFDAGE